MTDGPLAGLPRFTRLVMDVVAPTTLATGLLFYFGWSHAYWFFDYFGVNSTLVGLTTRDYLMRGLDGLFVPFIAIAVIGLAVVWGRGLLHERLGEHLRHPWWSLAFGGTGALLCANGLSRIVIRTPFNRPLAIAPLSLAAGVVMWTWAVRLWTADRERPELVGLVEYAAVFVLVGLSLFWAANDYSAAVGRSRAAQFVRELPSHPETIIYSKQSLSMTPEGVAMVRCEDPDSAYRYRYDGLALMVQSDEQYVLLPKDWSHQTGVAVVLPRNDDVRLEFVRASAASSLRPSC